MHERPYLLVSCAMSVDGYIDDASPARLILSSDADADRVDEVRSGCDAILVGAGTIRRDDPRLVIQSPERRARRLARGAPEDPAKVTITATGNLDPSARFFTTGGAARLVYCARPALATARARLSGVAEVIDAGDSPSPVLVLCDLAERGVASVLLEGGGQLAAEFLAADLADELHLVVAPFFVGDPAAPRFAVPGGYPHGPANRMRLAEVRQLGDVVLLRYLLGTRPDPRPPEHVSSPARASEPGGPPAAHVSSPGPASEPGGPPAAHLSSPARASEPSGPHAADIRWLRETIELLSAEDPELPGPHAEQSHGGQPYSGHPSDESRYREQSRGEQSRGEQSYSGHPSDDSRYREQSRGGQSRGGQSRGEQSRGGQSYSRRSYGGQPAGEPYGGQPSDEPRYGEQPSGPDAADLYWLRETIELSRRCPPSRTAFSVGAVIVGADGTPLATGYSREVDPRDHAEEAALSKLRPGDSRLAGATLYSSLEPCGARASRPHPCAELIIAAGLRRVVYAWREPPLLATGGGDGMLRAAGVSVTEVPELAAEAREVNAHLTGTPGPPGH